MKSSPAGRAFLTREEGCVLHRYLDRAGRPTIGIGHLIRPGETFPVPFTAADADALLSRDLEPREAFVAGVLTAPTTQNQFDAFISFAFNEGLFAFSTSTLLRLHNEGRPAEELRPHFLEWDKRHDEATGLLVVDEGLRQRRAREWALYATPDDPAIDAAQLLALVDRTSTELLRQL